jgi:HAMP domain-containing protein
MKQLSDLTWRDALLIELASLRDRVERKMPIASITATRIAGLIEEYEKERQEARTL